MRRQPAVAVRASGVVVGGGRLRELRWRVGRCYAVALLVALLLLTSSCWVRAAEGARERGSSHRSKPRPPPPPASPAAASASASSSPSLSPSPSIPASSTHVFHIIAHSHCDPGWLSTFEGYYMQDVSGILNSALQALQRDRSRKFVWSETSYFARWWETLGSSQRSNFRTVLSAGQFEFVNGGWSQHDEACPDPLSMIQQMTTGHQYLLHQFGIVPRVAWQIDPFGHSAVTPTLFALMGFQALVINRVHHQIKDYLKEKKMMEFIWTGGYDWEEYAQAVDDGNVAQRAAALISVLKGRAAAYRHRHLLVPFGDDFKFRNAELQFSNMGRLVRYIQEHSAELGVWAQFSTLSDYFSAAHSEGQFPALQGDFMPYADNEQSYWTGYYTTRPLLKDRSRILGAQLRAAELLHVVVRGHGGSSFDSVGRVLPVDYWEVQFSALETARQETALFLHHDAITGTSRSNVVQDYLERMQRASQKLQLMMANMVQHLITKEPHPTPLLTASPYTIDIADAQQQQQATTERRGADSSALEPLYSPFVLFNPLAWHREEVVSVKVGTRHVLVVDPQGRPVQAQVDMEWENHAATSPLQSVFSVRFVASLPPLSVVTYFLHLSATPHANSDATQQSVTTIFSLDNRLGSATEAVASRYLQYADWKGAQLTIDNPLLALHFSPNTGLLDSIHDIQHSTHLTATQKFELYRTTQSGAYLFRPNPEMPEPLFPSTLPASACIRIVHGRVLSWLSVSHHRFDVTYSLPARPFHALAPSFSLSVLASAASNTEVLLTTDTDLRSSDVFYTHNGWQFLRRVRHSGPRPSHFYPMVAAFRVQDEDSGGQPARRLTLTTSHTCAASAPSPGRVELLIHRHLSQDDGRGLAEGVADNSRQDISLTFSLQSVDHLQPSLPTSTVHFDDERSLNEQLLRVQHPPLPFYLSRSAQSQPPAGYAEFSAVAAQPVALFERLDDWHRHQLSSISPLARAFPPNVHLHSLMARDAVSDDVALRLQHLGVDMTQESDRAALAEEDRATAAKVTLDLTSLFSSSTRITELRRVGLTLNHRWPFNGRRRHRHARAEDSGAAAEDADSLHPGWLFTADASESVLDTVLLRAFLSQRSLAGRGAGGANQNSQEEGVFISEAALRAEAEKKKKMALEEEQQRTQAGGGGGGGQVRRALLALGHAAQSSMSSLSLPLLHLEPYQLQSFILHYTAVEEEPGRDANDFDPHSTPHQPSSRSPRTNTQAQQQPSPPLPTPRISLRSPTAPSPSPLSTTASPVPHGRVDAQGPGGGAGEAEGGAMVSDSPLFLHHAVSVNDGEGPTSFSLLATIPSRLEYLLILLVCLLAVAFFALALGLLPSKAVRRAALHLRGTGAGGGVNGGHGGGGGGGGGGGSGAGAAGGGWSHPAPPAHSLSQRLTTALFAFEHSASMVWHRLRAVTLHLRYGRTGQRMGGGTGGGGGGGTTAA